MEIWHELTCRYTPEQNGITERRNLSIMETTQGMLEEKSMPKFYWAKAVWTTLYIQKRIRCLHTSRISSKSQT